MKRVILFFERTTQVSREGFQSIDEYLENHRNVDRHEWVTQPQYENMKDYELMTNRVEWAYPTQTREFVALDIIDRPRKILISKSALHPDRPGGSRYQTEVPLDEHEFVRAVQYYASKVEPLPDGKCLLRMVTWGEMCDSYTAFWINKFNAHVFITPKYKRFRRVMEDGETVFELSNIVNEAWKLPKLLMIKPDHSVAKGSNFVDNLRNQGIEVRVRIDVGSRFGLNSRVGPLFVQLKRLFGCSYVSCAFYQFCACLSLRHSVWTARGKVAGFILGAVPPL